MSALIIMLARWRMAKTLRPRQLPPAIDVALDHVVWLRQKRRRLTARAAGEIYGLDVYTWAELVRGLADIWERLPARIRRGG